MPENDTTQPDAISASEQLPVSSWTAKMDWAESCRPNYYGFCDDVSEEALAFLAEHSLTFTEDSDDYEIRYVLLEKLKSFDPEEHPLVPELIDAVECALCPVDCCYCAESEVDYLKSLFCEALTDFEKTHPDVVWVVTDWRKDTICAGTSPDVDVMSERHLDVFRSWSGLTVEVDPSATKFAELTFDGTTFTVYAFTDALDVSLARRAMNLGDEVEPDVLVSCSTELKSVMEELYELCEDGCDDADDVDLPRRLRIPSQFGGDGIDSVYGSLGDARLAVMATVAAPTVGMTPQQRRLAITTMLTDSEPDWAVTVDAFRAAVA